MKKMPAGCGFDWPAFCAKKKKGMVDKKTENSGKTVFLEPALNPI
jgi:hypothetical protein